MKFELTPETKDKFIRIYEKTQNRLEQMDEMLIDRADEYFRMLELHSGWMVRRVEFGYQSVIVKLAWDHRYDSETRETSIPIKDFIDKSSWPELVRLNKEKLAKKHEDEILKERAKKLKEYNKLKKQLGL